MESKLQRGARNAGMLPDSRVSSSPWAIVLRELKKRIAMISHSDRLIKVCSYLLALASATFSPVETAEVFNCDGVLASPGEELRAELVLDGLNKPIDIQAPPGDLNRLFIVEHTGTILILDLGTNKLRTRPFLDVTTKVDVGSEKGLIGLVFHPRYRDNGTFYIHYCRENGPTGLESVISRYTVSTTDPNQADPDSELILLTYEQPFTTHNGGQLAFGPLDGYLYVSSGDGGDGGDPGNRAQNPTLRLGKILRLDVDGKAPYIPPTNPFLKVPGAAQEIWALGLRNPWRMTFDQLTGDLYIADVGQGDYEEINFQPGTSAGGENYEWKVREGRHDFSAETAFGPGQRSSPVLEYGHSNTDFIGCSVTGGVVYRGCRLPDLHGAYFFADYCQNWIRTLRIKNGRAVEIKDHTSELNVGLQSDPIDNISSFGVDGRGEVYICDLKSTALGEKTAKLYRIIPKNPPLPRITFSRGNANGDRELNLADVLYTLGYLFRGNPVQVPCADALDSNDDGSLNIADAVYVLYSLFGGGLAPPPPAGECGKDPTADALSCEANLCG